MKLHQTNESVQECPINSKVNGIQWRIQESDDVYAHFKDTK